MIRAELPCWRPWAAGALDAWHRCALGPRRRSREGHAGADGRRRRGFLRLGRPPLRADVERADGPRFLRHRSFLAHVASGTYEPEYRQLFEAELRPGATVVDAGAHVGAYTLLGVARAVGPYRPVIAIEPDPVQRAGARGEPAPGRLRQRHDRPRRPIADAPGRARFQQSLGTISSSFEARDGRGPFREFDTDVTSVDAELAGTEIGALVVKLDVEGAEPRRSRG